MSIANDNGAADAFMAIIRGFAAAQTRFEQWTEREIHPIGERPPGPGWRYVREESGFGIWKRGRITEMPR